MHVLYGLKAQGFSFELKGGTSLSKGFKVIHRFSEDIDIHITPPKEFGINENPKNNKPNNVANSIYNGLASNQKLIVRENLNVPLMVLRTPRYLRSYYS